MTPLTIFLALILILTACVWTLNTIRTAAQHALRLPDGSPTIDEYVTRPMLSLSQTCAQLCHRIYGRLEDLPTALVDGLDGLQFDTLLTSASHDAVCAVVYYQDAVIIVWRGTNITNRKQVKANRCCDLTMFDARIKGRVHYGLMDLFAELRVPLLKAIGKHAVAGRKIYVTGHSQGGGLASLTCAALRQRYLSSAQSMYLPSGMITFGSMRAGDEQFARYVDDSCRYDPATGRFGIQRFRNNNDIVPLVTSRRLPESSVQSPSSAFFRQLLMHRAESAIRYDRENQRIQDPIRMLC